MIGRFLLRLVPWWIAWVFLLPWWVYVGAALAMLPFAAERFDHFGAQRATLDRIAGQPAPPIVPLDAYVVPGSAQLPAEVHLRMYWRRDIAPVLYPKMAMGKEYALFQSGRPPLVFVALEGRTMAKDLEARFGDLPLVAGLDIRGLLIDNPTARDALRAHATAWGGRGNEPILIVRPWLGDRDAGLAAERDRAVWNQLAFPALAGIVLLIGVIKFAVRPRRRPVAATRRPTHAASDPAVPLAPAKSSRQDIFADGPIVSLRRTGKDVR